MKVTHGKTKGNSAAPSRNPYIGQRMHPGLARLLEAAEQDVSARRTSYAEEQFCSECEDDDSRIDGVETEPTDHFNGGSTPRPTSAVLPPPQGRAIATFAGDDGDDDVRPTGVYSGLASLHPDTIIDKRRLAGIFGVSEKTIRRRVAAGDLPPAHMRIGRNPQWLVGELLDWLKSAAKRKAEHELSRRQHIRTKTK